MHWQTMAMCDGFITDALIRLSRACADAHADPRVNEALPDDPDGFKNVLRADMEREDELRTVPSWKAHMLTGDRKGTWSLFVTKNWRMTFRIDRKEIEIIDLDYEDYH